MKTALVGGRFVSPDGVPARGMVRFIPAKIWLEDEDGKTYPCLAPEMVLEDGSFVVTLTRTDTYAYPWYYTAVTPIGRWSIQVIGEGPHNLKYLLPKTAT